MTSSIVLAYKLELHKRISEDWKAAHSMLSMIKPRDLLPISQLIAQIADIYTLPGSDVSLRRYHDYESHLHYNHDHQHSSEWHADTTQCYSI